MEIRPTPGPVRKPPARELPHLADADQSSKAIRDEVVDPLRKSVAIVSADASTWKSAVGTVNNQDSAASLAESHLTGMQGVVRGLGITGSALGGFMGVAQLTKGLREGKAPLVLSGMAELTVSAAAMAALGLVPGAPLLAPVGAGLMGVRAVHDIQQKNDIDRIDGWRDMVTASSVLAVGLHAPVTLAASLGTAAAGFNLLRGLAFIKQGHEQHSAYRTAQGNGAIMAATGVSLIASGLGTAPGVALLLVGVAMPLLQRFHTSQPAVNRLTSATDHLLYPAALAADHVESRLHDLAAPLVAPVLKATGEAWNSAPMGPVRHLAEAVKHEVSEASSKVLDQVAHTKAAHLADAAYGKVSDVLAPPG